MNNNKRDGKTLNVCVVQSECLDSFTKKENYSRLDCSLRMIKIDAVTSASGQRRSLKNLKGEKAQKYKGRKIPGKYLTKNPGKMKKEIDTFRGKKEYKKDWDADYTGGKGGEGKRVKTKKSAATKAYQRMFGDK